MMTITEQSENCHSLQLRVGELLGLSDSIASEVDLVGRLRRAFPGHVVEALRTRAGLSSEEICRLIAPRRKLNRRTAEVKSLSMDEADRAVRVARIVARAQQIFSAQPVYALEWVRTSLRSLGDLSPMQLLITDAGARAVEELLFAIEHGQFN